MVAANEVETVVREHVDAHSALQPGLSCPGVGTWVVLSSTTILIKRPFSHRELYEMSLGGRKQLRRVFRDSGSYYPAQNMKRAESQVEDDI